MKRPKETLERLRLERDDAMERVRACLGGARERVATFDKEVQAFAVSHPFVAIGGAAVAGVAAGLLLSGQTIRHMTKAAAVVMLKPLAMDFVHRFVQQFGENDEVNE